MILRQLGFRAQVLEAGPYRILLSDSIPVAYVENGEAFRTEQFFSKATSHHINKWLFDLDLQAKSVAQSVVAAVFEGLDRYSGPLDRRLNGVDPIERAEFNLWKAERELERLRAEVKQPEKKR